MHAEACVSLHGFLISGQRAADRKDEHIKKARSISLDQASRLPGCPDRQIQDPAMHALLTGLRFLHL